MDDSSNRILSLLASRTNYERTRPDRPRLELGTMRALLERLGLARCAPRAVQVGGSKGKGTTAAWLESLARAGGLKVGVYASPHVFTLRERVRVDGALVDGELLEVGVRQVLAVTDGLEPAATFFEIMTAAAAWVFREAAADLAVFEVGLGGRLDATTALDADVGLVTSIELEHTEILGDTTARIAAEKAFVFRAGKVGFHSVDDLAACEVLEAHAERVGCRVGRRGREFDARCIAGTGLLELTRPGDRPREVAAREVPAYEHASIALAWAALGVVAPGLELPDVLVRPSLPGRFEQRVEPDGRLLVLDGAHTQRSSALLAEQLDRVAPGERWAILFASARGKRWREALSVLARRADTLIVTRLSGTESVDPDEVVAELARTGVRTAVAESAAVGLALLRQHQGPRLVAGSFYLIGELGPSLGDLATPTTP